MTNAAHDLKLTTIGLKRLITEAGRVAEQMKPLKTEYDGLIARIKPELVHRIEHAEDDIAVASGEFIATLTAEKKGRPVSLAAKEKLYQQLGHAAFVELCTIPMAGLKKAIDLDELNDLAPEKYSGGGRSFSLKKRF